MGKVAIMPVKSIANLDKQNQVIYRYCTEDGLITDESNPNGTLNNIAGICNRKEPFLA
jgi:phosphoribosylformylglycinamidine synthase